MISQTDNSPERISHHEILRARSELVEISAQDALASLYGEFGNVWATPTSVASLQPNSVGSVIDRTFMETNMEAQTSQLASDRAVNEAQQRVAEAFDEFSA